MKKSDKYIMFSRKQKGKDGYNYIQDVKYRIRKETANAFYLAGRRKNFHNRLIKSRLKDTFIIGDILRNEGNNGWC